VTGLARFKCFQRELSVIFTHKKNSGIAPIMWGGLGNTILVKLKLWELVTGVRLAYAPCAPHVRLMCARLGADGYLRFSLVS
jgi:hypothetical protein